MPLVHPPCQEKYSIGGGIPAGLHGEACDAHSSMALRMTDQVLELSSVLLRIGHPVSGDRGVPLKLAGLVDGLIAGWCSHLQQASCHVASNAFLIWL